MRIAIGAALAASLGLAACDAGTLKIALQVSGGPVQACPSSTAPAAPSCSDVPMLCDAVLDVRIVRPEGPQETYLSLCEAIPHDQTRDLCSIEHLDLPSRRLPKETLEVQVMIWPRSAVKEDPVTGLDCGEIYGRPASIGFGVHGFPEESAPAPALGGRAFYHPGDDLTVVTLGCSDLPSVNGPACAGPISIRAGVTELDRWTTPVSPPAALLVSIGEPRYAATRNRHEWQPIEALAPAPDEQAWRGALDVLEVQDALCVEVIGNTGTNTAAVRCERIDPTARAFALSGVWLPTARLDLILAGLGFAEVPPDGLTIGVVLDAQGNPARGHQIRTSPDTRIQYLGAGYQVVPGGSATTSTGLFVSTDALYGADFRAYQGDLVPKALGLGGRISGKVTIVVLRLGSGGS